MKLYFRFIFEKLLLTFLVIHFAILLSYFSFDLLSTRTHPRAETLFFHFLSILFLKSDLFLTLSFLLATIHTLQSLKRHNELTALYVGGISKFHLTLPYVTLTLLLALFSYANVEWAIPKARTWTLTSQKKSAIGLPFEIKHLKDGSRIVYQQEGKRIFDLYWIKSTNEIWHCKEVVGKKGFYVDKLQKNPLGRFEKGESFDQWKLPFSLNEAREFSPSIKATPFSTLFQILKNNTLALTSDHGQVLTIFLYKLVHPWFPLLFLFGSFAFLLSSHTQSPHFPFLIGIFFYLLFYAMMKTFIILGENYIISPWVTLILVPLGLQGVFVYKLCRN